jgi:hypothetical protein
LGDAPSTPDARIDRVSVALVKPVAPRPGVQDQRALDGKSLLDALRPSNKRWLGRASDWVFRGQADAAWKLTSKAMRSPGAFVDFGLQGGLRDWSARAATHVEMLGAFRNNLDGR